MPYTYGTKNGPSVGKSAPGLPVSAQYTNTVNTTVNSITPSTKDFANSTFLSAAYADWNKLTTASTPGSASGTVSNIITVQNTSGMRFGSDNNGFSGALKVADNYFVMLTSEVADHRRTNLTLFDVSTGCVASASIGVSSGGTYGQAAQIVPSSQPQQFLVTWKNYETGYQEVELYRTDINSTSISVARTGVKTYTAALSTTANEFGLPWTINPLGNINGKETWIAIHPNTAPCFVTYSAATGALIVVSAAMPYPVGYMQKVQENTSDAFLVGFHHPYAGGSQGTTWSFSSLASIKLNKNTLAWTRLQDAFTNDYGSSGVFNPTTDYYHGGMRSYGFNGSGFLLSYRASYITADGKPGYCHVDAPPPSSALSYIDSNGVQKTSIVQSPGIMGSVSSFSLTPIGEKAVAARGSSTEFFANSAHHEKTNSGSFTTINIAYLHDEGYIAQKYVSLPFMVGEINSMQIVPFGDCFLVLSKGNATSVNAQAVWVYPR